MIFCIFNYHPNLQIAFILIISFDSINDPGWGQKRKLHKRYVTCPILPSWDTVETRTHGHCPPPASIQLQLLLKGGFWSFSAQTFFVSSGSLLHYSNVNICTKTKPADKSMKASVLEVFFLILSFSYRCYMPCCFAKKKKMLHGTST